MSAPVSNFFTDTLRSIRSNDCCSYISYTSFYDVDVRIGVVYFTNLDLYRLDCCGGRVLVENKTNISSHTVGPVVFDTDICDGSYVLVVSYTEPKSGTTYTEELEICLKCCAEKRSSLVCTIKSKMSDISCKINQYQAVGRRVLSLQKSYLKLSNILYVLNERSCCGMLIPLTCEEVEKLNCLIQTIK